MSATQRVRIQLPMTLLAKFRYICEIVRSPASCMASNFLVRPITNMLRGRRRGIETDHYEMLTHTHMDMMGCAVYLFSQIMRLADS